MSTGFKYLDLSALPVDWTADHFGNLVDYNLGRTPPRNSPYYWKDGIYPWVSISDMKPYGVLQETVEKVSQQAFDEVFRGRLAPEGSLLMSFKLTIGRISRLGVPAFHNEAIISFKPDPKKISPEYLGYYLSQINYKDYQDTAIKGQTLNKGKLDSLEISLPPLPEQKAIAHTLATVQRAIRAQERIIQTTTELKQALMQKLFSEGLRGKPQKETEIGLVPESWGVVECGDACDTISVGIVVQPASYYVKEGVPAFRSQNVRADRIQVEPMVYISNEANDGPVKKSKLFAGDVLIVRTGYPGTSCVVPPELEGSNCIDLIFARPDKARLSSHYLSRFFNSDLAKRQVQAGKTGLAQQHYNVGAVKSTKIPLPSLGEQEKIVSYLELIDSKVDTATSRFNVLQEIFYTLLHELMTAKTRANGLTSLSSAQNS